MLGIYKFYWYCGRMGDLDGIFVADSEAVASAIGQRVYFGEVLGKHSEIHGTLEDEDLQLLSDNPAFVDKFVEIMGGGTISGFNPLEYLEGGD